MCKRLEHHIGKAPCLSEQVFEAAYSGSDQHYLQLLMLLTIIVGMLIPYPRVFAENHPTCTTTSLHYMYEMDHDYEDTGADIAYLNWPSERDLDRSEGREWEYLMHNRRMGDVYIHSRGKQVAIAAGYVRHRLLFQSSEADNVTLLALRDYQLCAGGVSYRGLS